MHVLTKKLKLETKGDPEMINITSRIEAVLKDSKLKEGIISVFVVGSTAALTSFEFEPGLIEDMQGLYGRLIPRDKSYRHDDTWGDANGFSHLRAALQGPSLVIPFTEARLLLGTWQQVVLAEFDNRPRKREVIVQLIGE